MVEWGGGVCGRNLTRSWAQILGGANLVGFVLSGPSTVKDLCALTRAVLSGICFIYAASF